MSWDWAALLTSSESSWSLTKTGSCVQTTSTSQLPCSVFSVLVHMFLREPRNYSPSHRWSEWQRIWMCSVAESCLTLYDPMDHSLSDSSVHEILQARILEWVVIPFSRGFSWPRDRSHLSSRFQADFLPLSHQGSPESLKDLDKVTPLKCLGSNPASFPSQVCSKHHVPDVQKVLTISSTAGVLKSPWWLKGVPCVPDVFANLVVCIEIWST